MARVYDYWLGGKDNYPADRAVAGRLLRIYPPLRDLVRPVCVILGAVLHFLDADAARIVTAGYARLMAPGSCLVISVASFDDEAMGLGLRAGAGAVHQPGENQEPR